jgi:uncharacterized phage-like protein YoqJ
VIFYAGYGFVQDSSGEMGAELFRAWVSWQIQQEFSQLGMANTFFFSPNTCGLSPQQR